MPAEGFVIERTGHELLRYRDILQQHPSLNHVAPPSEDEGEITRFRQTGEVHKWMYDRWSLRVLMERCGFGDITVCTAKESQIPDFERYELDITTQGQTRKPDSLFMEARKPLETKARSHRGSSRRNRSASSTSTPTTFRAARPGRPWRLHDELRRAGNRSQMLTLFKVSDDTDVHPVEGESDDAAKSALAHWADLSEQFIRHNRSPVTDCFFSLPVPGYDLALHPAVQAADVIHLHWVAGLLSPQAIARLQRLGKPLVWTLHDQRAFTGGCHFSFGCKKYEDSCADCPQLGPKAPCLSSGILAESLQWINPAGVTVATPSRWMAACASLSTLFRHARINLIPNGVDAATFRPRNRAAARESLGLDPKAFYFLFGTDSIQDRRKGCTSCSTR
ncbi:MAG: glycosyltransferase [Verrucomicrobiota bacterium]